MVNCQLRKKQIVMNSTTWPRIGHNKLQRLKQRKKDNDLKLASWNVRTLLRQGALRTLTDTLKKSQTGYNSYPRN